MHCPGCGQQQISNETKFCSRCGLPLGVVAEVLFHGGYLPQLAEINKKKTIFSRRNGKAFSLIWFLFFILITALWAIVEVEELAAASGVIAFFGGLIIFVSSLLFLKKPSPQIMYPHPAQPPAMYGQPQHAALPHAQSIPVSGYTPQAGNWRDTNDLVPSVTEGTTKLLDKDDQ